MVDTFDIGFGLVGVVRVERHAALADRVDGQAVGGVGEVDDASGRWAVGHGPRRRSDLGREVVRHLMSAGGLERADVEDALQGLLRAQRMVMGQGMGLAPLPLGGIWTEGGFQVRKAGVPGGLDHVGTGFPSRCGAVVPPR
ncbi:hypothetical protein D3C78_1456500 [compost metagenome]